MTLTINTNMSSIIAQRSLNKATKSMDASLEKMTTGYKINHASDNAAGYSIADNWVTKLGSLEVATDNASMGADMLTTAEESYALLTSHLQRIRDLTEQAANGTYGTQSLRAIQAEIAARAQEINRTVQNIEYNGINLMDGSVKENVDLQVGLYSDPASQITLDKSLFADASITGLFQGKTIAGAQDFDTLLSNGGADFSTTNTSALLQSFAATCVGMKYEWNSTESKYELKLQSGEDTNKPKELLEYLDQAINNIADRVTAIGAAQNRVSSAIDAIDVQSQNLTSSLSTLRDTDVASESSTYLQAQILQQASATLLATANQTPSIALSLI